MYYSRIEESGNGLILKRDSTLKIFYWLLLVFSIITLLPGLLLILDPDTGFTTNFVLGFGLVLFAGALLLNDQRKKFPEAIEFLNQEQTVRISGGKKVYSFLFSEIDHLFRRTTRNGSMICLMKKDGSVWDLMSLNSVKEAERRLAQLKEKIKIKPGITLPEIKYPLPASFQNYENHGKTYFYWKEKQIGKQLSLVFLMLVGFGTMLGYSLKGSHHFTVFLFCFLSALFLIASYFIYLIITTRNRSSMLVFDMSDIFYGQGKILGMDGQPEFRAKKTMTVTDLDSIRYSFDGFYSFFYSIMFLDKETVEGINKLEGEDSYGAIMDIRGILKTYSHLFKFNISGKDVIDIANFAAVLKKTAHDKYGK